MVKKVLSTESEMNNDHSGHSHAHGHKDLEGSRLLLAVVLNAIITIAEIIGGLLSNSLALLSDAIHNLGDTVSIIVAYIANRVGKKSANKRKTFGYKRIEILAALFNATTLIVIVVFLLRESWIRYNHPEPVKGLLMFSVALIGLFANLFSVFILKNHSHHNINIKAAYLHLLGDTISSVAVIIGSALIYFFKIYWIDPLITVLIGLYILRETVLIVKQSVNILMQATPRNINLLSIKEELEKFDEIENIHHVHVWNLTDTQIHFECHADVSEDLCISQTQPVLLKIDKVLQNKFGISHVTIQFEYNCCSGKELINQK